MARWVPFAKFGSQVEAQVVRSVLEAAGIPVNWPNENLSNLGVPGMSLPGFGITLSVLDTDLERARAVLAEADMAGGDDAPDTD